MTTMTFSPTLTARPAVAHHTRLTRRGRWAVFAVGFAVAVALFVALSGGTVATADRAPADTTRVIQVVPGQTLWDVASEASGGSDVRTMMTRIEQLNGLQSTQLMSGEHLRVPVG